MTYTRSSSRTVELRSNYRRFMSVLSPDYGEASNLHPPGHATKTVGSALTGEKSHSWRRKIRSHLNASTGLSAWKKTYSGGYGFDRVDWTDIRFLNGKNVPVPQYEEEWGKLIYLPAPGSLPSFPPDLSDQARAKVYKSAQRAITSMRSMTTMGELGETLRMIRNPLKTLRGSFGDYFQSVVRRTRRAKKFRRKGIIRDTYMEWTFGITPTLQDIRSANEALERRLERYQGFYTRVSGEAKSNEHVAVPNYGSYSQGINTVRRWGYDEYTQCSFRYYGEVASVNPDPITADRRLLGISWADVALTGWELIPYSFVADYFTNIGDVLESWTVRQEDWRWMASVKRVRVKRKSTTVRPIFMLASQAGYEPSYGSRRFCSVSPVTTTYSSVQRSTPLSGPGNLSFQFDLGMSARRFLNLSGLADSHREAIRRVKSR